MGLVYDALTGNVQYLIELGGDGGGSAKQATLLSITTAPSGTFEKGSQYYNSNTKLIYTAVEDNTWDGAKPSNPEFGTIYIFDNQGTTEYYQWDGDNLVETDLEKYQLIANITDDFTESSKTKYPSSFALFKGLGTVRPSKVNNSGASLPVDLSDYSLGDTFLNITNKKLYTAKADAYELNTGVFNSATIDFNTGIATNFAYAQQTTHQLYKTLSFNPWTGNKNYQIKFKILSFANDNLGLFNFYSSTGSGSSYFIGFGITNRKIVYTDASASYGSYSSRSEIICLNTEIQINKEYTLTIEKLSDSCTVTLYENGIEKESNSFTVSDITSTSNYTFQYGTATFKGSESQIYVKNLYSYGEIYLLESSGDFLKASGTLVWDDGEDLIDLAQYADITNGILYFYCENQLFSNKPNNLTFNNVSASTWVADNTYQDYGYKCELNCNGVKANMFAQVIFNPTEADSGNYATVAQTGNNIITIYSKVNDTITIPNIVVMGV